MGVQFGWYIAERVIYINFYNRVSERDYERLHAGLAELLSSKRGQPIHIIQDESNITSLTADAGRVYKESVIAQGKVTGAIITIGRHKSHPVMNFISATLAKIGNNAYQSFNTLEEAEEYLSALDSTLDFSAAARDHLEMTYSPQRR
ncbi:MAG: hypothetical protein AAFR81_01925 [Chloroflexota bacterium]